MKKFVSKNPGKRTRKNQKLEIYSQKYYVTRFKNQVDQEISNTTPPDESKEAYQKRKMLIYQKWRSLSWQMESDEVKAEIEALWNQPDNLGDDVSGDYVDAEGESDPDHETGGYGG